MKNKMAVAFIEVVISLLLLGIAIGAILGAFVIGSATAARVKHRLAAINLARQKIEGIKAVPYNQIPAQGGTESVIIDPGSPATGDELNGLRFTVIFPYTSEGMQMYVVQIIVRWIGYKPTKPLTESITTLIGQH